MMRSMMLSRVIRSASACTSTSGSAMRASMAAVRNLSYSAGSSTYYDSQSGMEVPVNNEDEISVFFDHRSGGGSPDTNTTMTLEQIQEAGFQGVLWPPPTLATEATPSTSAAAHDGFTLFVDSESDLEKIQLDQDHVNLVFEYIDDDDNSNSTGLSLQKRLAAHVENGTKKTTIGMFDACYYQRDPILVASGVATLIDKTGGGDFIWVQPPTNNNNEDNEGSEEEDDSVIDLCQQLSYLDVAGPTIKSRLIVTAQSEYQVEECLSIGVNKFVFQHPNPNGVKWFSDMVEEQGKNVKLAVSRP